MSFGWGIAAWCLLRKIQGNFILGRKVVALLHNVAAVMTSLIPLVAPIKGRTEFSADRTAPPSLFVAHKGKQ